MNLVQDLLLNINRIGPKQRATQGFIPADPVPQNAIIPDKVITIGS